MNRKYAIKYDAGDNVFYLGLYGFYNDINNSVLKDSINEAMQYAIEFALLHPEKAQFLRIVGIEERAKPMEFDLVEVEV